MVPYEPVADICAALDKLQADTGLDVPVHVDAASGGFIAPFIDPHLVWDFRLPRVQSINTSGHKNGLVYPGVGWIVWRDPGVLPDDLVFNVNYLGGNMPTFALNFSRPGIRLPRSITTSYGWASMATDRVQQTSREVAQYAADAIAKLGPFQLITDGSELPVFAFALKEGGPYTVFDVSERLRENGWLVPAYTFPENRQDLAALRIVIRNGMSHDLADLLVADLKKQSHCSKSSRRRSRAHRTRASITSGRRERPLTGSCPCCPERVKGTLSRSRSVPFLSRSPRWGDACAPCPAARSAEDPHPSARR